MPNKTRKSLNNKSKTICIQCKTQVLESDEALECDSCQKTLHSLCSKLDKKQYDKLVKNPSLEYKCHFCVPSDNVYVGANDLAEIKTKLNQLDDIRDTMHFMSSQYDAILKGVKKNNKQIKTLKKQNENLREEVKSLKSTVKFLNDVRVQKDCIINGIETNGTEKAEEVVLAVAKKTGADICEDDIEEAYFLNHNKQNNGNKNQKAKSIVVKFTTKKNKQIFMQEKSKLKQIDELKETFINDFLCKESLELLNYARSLKAVGFKFVYARSSNIFAKKDEKSRPICLKSMDDVDKLLCKSAGGKVKRNIVSTVDISDDEDDEDGDEEEDEDDDTQFESSN